MNNLFKMRGMKMIKELSLRDIGKIYEIINEAARVYRDVIPDDCYHEPYMTKEELRREMERMTFFGWDAGGDIVGVMGCESIKDVTLVRHAYVLPDFQKSGVGTKLIDHIKQTAPPKRLLVGTWAGAIWAIQFYRKHGFKLLPNKDQLLREYWDISPRQIETSVVLGIET
ncbi:MAG: GNAT family N-acetyltransferase [Dehalococcoidales bacterium]|nr:GNAT family N-acetyltransferase [Dehalococcoidales bacterium]